MPQCSVGALPVSTVRFHYLLMGFVHDIALIVAWDGPAPCSTQPGWAQITERCLLNGQPRTKRCYSPGVHRCGQCGLRRHQ